MTINRTKCGAGAFTLIELLCVLAIIGILAALLLPALTKAGAQAKRVQCVNQLRQIGIAFQNFAQDHNGQFPMSLPASSGGTMEFARNAYGIAGEFFFSFRYFLVLSNELVTPKLLVCPADTRQPVLSFSSLGNQGVSYFVGISAVTASPNSILAGDRNLTNDWARPATLLHFGPNDSLRWTAELHRFKGNLLFADGHVEEKNTPGLVMGGNQAAIVSDLALPTVENGLTGTALSQGSTSTRSDLASQGPTSAAEPAAKRPFQNQASSAGENVQSNPNSRIATGPGWRTGFSSSQSQPDSPPMTANLQPGNRSNVFVTNSTFALSKPEDPGFSLFPPLAGQGGLLRSTGGKWVLLIIILLLLIGLGLLLKRHVVRSRVIRKAYHDFVQMR